MLLETQVNKIQITLDVGGIDIHAEWSSPLSFMYYHNESFLTFKSVHFSHDFMLSLYE